MPVTVYRRGQPFTPPAWEGQGGALLLRPLPQEMIAESAKASKAEDLNPVQEADRVLKACLSGWEGVQDEDGEPLVFEPERVDAMVDLLDGAIRLDAFHEILRRSGLTETDRKNSGSASSSPAPTGSKASTAGCADDEEPSTDAAEAAR